MTQAAQNRAGGLFSRLSAAWAARRDRPDAPATGIAAQASGTQLTLEELARLYDALPTGTPRVDERSAMRASAVYACVSLIAGKIASLPLPVLERTPDGPRALAAPHDYWWLLNERPHPDLSATTFWRYIVESMMLVGDGFAQILRPSFASTRVTGLLALHPRRVEPFRHQTTRQLLYRITPETGPQYILHPADILHFATGFGFDGLRSLSPIQYAGQTAIGIALAADEYSARFFSNSARPDVVLTTDKGITPEAARVLRETWASRHTGSANAHLPAILTGGLSLEQITMSAEDAQLLTTRGFQVEELARLWGVPPFMIGHNEKTTSWGSGVSAMGSGFVRYTLDNYTDPIETEINYKFWPSRERFFVEHDTGEIERAELKTRYDAYRVGLGRAGEPGFITVNDVRRAERLPAIDGGDEINRGQGKPAADPALGATEGNTDEKAADAAGEKPAA